MAFQQVDSSVGRPGHLNTDQRLAPEQKIFLAGQLTQEFDGTDLAASTSTWQPVEIAASPDPRIMIIDVSRFYL